MNDTAATDRPALDGPEPPVARLRRRRGIPAVWAVPLVAALIAAFLAYRSYTSQGPVVTITFATAEGLEAGKTKVRYLDVEVGTVEAVTIDPELRRIVVTARMVPEATGYLREGTRFWIVKPRVGVGGVSGLGTLLSGAYVGLEPGAGEPAWTFTGLEEPPRISANVPGRQYFLRAERLGSLFPGSPVYFQGIEVGQVLGHELVPDQRAVDVSVFVQAPYADLVRTNSRFWNASGVDLRTTASGVELEVASLQSLLLGGIEFDTPPSSAASEVAPPDTRFPLFDSRGAVAQAQFTEKVPFLAYFDGSVRGLSPGAPVEFRGFRLGSVSEVRLEYDPATRAIRIPVLLELEPQRLLAYGSEMPADGEDHPLMAQLVRQGLRAQLQTGNFLTGELFVDLVMVPGAPPAELDTRGDVPVIPTVPATLEELQASATQILDKLASLPIDELAQSLNNTARGLESLVNAPELRQALETLGPAMTQLQATVARLDREAGPLLASLRGTAESATVTLEAAQRALGSGSPLAADIERLMQELTRAARSIRVFADYLERHPEALLRGRTGASLR